MPSSSVCWGIELGAGAIKAVKLAAGSGGDVELLDYAYVPHKRVLSTPELDVDDAMRVAVGQLATRHDFDDASIAVSIPGHQSFARFAKLPPVEIKKIDPVIKYEAMQQIPFPPDEVEWDYQTFQSDDSPEIEVGIFAITKERINQQLALLRDVDIVPDIIQLAPVAAYNAIAYDLTFTESTPGTVILDVGTTSTDLVVADSGRVWVRTFPMGGHQFTEALVEAFNLSYVKAEKLKREAESSKHARHVFRAMKDVFQDLAQETQRSIGYYQSLHPEAQLQRVIGIGNTFRLPGLRRFLKQQLQMDVYRIDQFKRLILDGPEAGEFGALALEMCPAYGLAIQGLGNQTINANLMPTSVVREVMWKKKVGWFGVGAGLAAAAAGSMFIRPFLDSSAIAAQPKPPAIQRALGEGTKLKNAANDAGVTDSTPYSTTLGEMLGLFDRPEMIALLTRDMSELLEDTEAMVPDWKTRHPGGPDWGFRLLGWDTTFEFAGGQQQSRRGAAEDDPFAGVSKLHITARLATDQADPQAFLIETLGPWLREHAKREGLPYQFVVGSALEYKQIATAGSEDEPDLFYGPAIGEAQERGRFRDAGRAGGAGTRGGGGGNLAGGVVGARSTNQMDDFAPLPDLEDAKRPAAAFEVKWTVALTPYVPEEGDQAGGGGN